MPRIHVNLDQVIKGLDKEKELSKKALQRTVGDMRTRGPGWVSKAVREEYNIKAGDVKSAMHTEKGGTISFGGVVVDDVSLVYKGRVLTPTHFGMKPTARPARKSYTVTAEIKKGARKALSSKAFLAHSGGGASKSIPFQRTGTARLPIEAIKTLSVPQMVQDGNGNLKPSVDKAINENLEKRFHHYTQLYLGK